MERAPEPAEEARGFGADGDGGFCFHPRPPLIPGTGSWGGRNLRRSLAGGRVASFNTFEHGSSKAGSKPAGLSREGVTQGTPSPRGRDPPDCVRAWHPVTWTGRQMTKAQGRNAQINVQPTNVQSTNVQSTPSEAAVPHLGIGHWTFPGHWPLRPWSFLPARAQVAAVTGQGWGVGEGTVQTNVTLKT